MSENAPPTEPAGGPDPEPSPSRRWWLWTTDDTWRHLSGWPLLRHLIFERSFRYAWLGCLLVVLLLAAGLPKMWIVTPPAVRPVIRASWLDLLEARLLAERAHQADARGEPATAADHWRAALVQDPGDPALLRGSLANLLRLPPRDAGRFARALGDTFWLLQLTATNAVDLDLALEVCRHYGMDDLLLRLSADTPHPLTPRQQTARLKASLRLGDGPAFAAARLKLPPAVAAADPELPLYDAAWHAGWGRPADAAAGRAALEQAGRTGAPALGERALRLLLLAAQVRRDRDLHGRTLARLRDLHLDRPIEHADHWDLLRQAGRRDEAARLALRFADPPVSSTEVLRLAESFLALGLTGHASQFLAHFAPRLGVTSDVWLAHTELLVRQQRWQELREVALEIRRNHLAKHLLGGFSHYLDGLAELAARRTNHAAVAFAKVPSAPIREAAIALRTAQDLLAHGAVAPALELLRTRAPELRLRPDYWQTLQSAAYRRRDADLLLEAARRRHELVPDRPEAANDLAAALIIHRQDPVLLLTLTRRGIAAAPTSFAARLNHACALLLNAQPAAAKPLLLSLDEAGLGALERSLIALAHAELAALEGRPAEALQALARVQPRLLLAPQAARVGQLRADLEARAGPAK